MFWSSPETSRDALEIGHREQHARRAVGNLVRTGEMALYGGAVPGDLLDLILIALAAAFAVAGYRQGFIVGVLSFVGFLGGAAVGAVFSPAIARALVSGPARQALVAIIVVFLAAMVGQLVASLAGAAVRSRVTWRPATFVERHRRRGRQRHLGPADRLADRLGGRQRPLPRRGRAGRQLGGAARGGQVHAPGRSRHVLRLPPPAGQRPLYAGLRRARGGKLPHRAAARSRRGQFGGAEGGAAERGQDRGRGPVLLAQPGGLGFRVRAPPRPHERSRGGGGAERADGHPPAAPLPGDGRALRSRTGRRGALRARASAPGPCPSPARRARGPMPSSPGTR